MFALRLTVDTDALFVRMFSSSTSADREPNKACVSDCVWMNVSVALGLWGGQRQPITRRATYRTLNTAARAHAPTLFGRPGSLALIGYVIGGHALTCEIGRRGLASEAGGDALWHLYADCRRVCFYSSH